MKFAIALNKIINLLNTLCYHAFERFEPSELEQLKAIQRQLKELSDAMAEGY